MQLNNTNDTLFSSVRNQRYVDSPSFFFPFRIAMISLVLRLYPYKGAHTKVRKWVVVGAEGGVLIILPCN